MTAHLQRPLPPELAARLPALRRRVAQLLDAHPHGVLRQIGNTPLVALPSPPHVRLWGKLEGKNPSNSVKDRPVLYLIADALERGLGPDDVLVEASSGNTGVSLAMLGAALGRRVLIFMPDNVSLERRDLMRAYGAWLRLTPGERGTDGAIEAARAQGGAAGFYWLAQHENEANTLAHYDTTGAELLTQRPDLCAFVAASGTTGTLVGASMRLKGARPEVEVVAVWPRDWIMGLRRPEGAARPVIYRPDWIDRVIEIADAEAKAGARALAREAGLLLGPSAAAAWLAARRYAEALPVEKNEKHIVVLCCDEGARYLSTDTFDGGAPSRKE